MFLLDTDHISIIQRKTQPEFGRLRSRMDRYPAEAFYTSIITFHEQMLGWNSYINRANDSVRVVNAYRMFEQILIDFASANILSFDNSAAAIFDHLREQKIRVSTFDLRIGATAVSQGKTLLTRNLVDFRKIPMLSVEDWLT